MIYAAESNMGSKFFILYLLVFFSSKIFAEVKPYVTTVNSGQNKLERIDSVDKYLSELSMSLKSMEDKLDENSRKLKTLEEVMKSFKDAKVAEAQKIVSQQVVEKKVAPPKDLAELEKLKADILVLKNEDIEKLKADFSDLNETVKALQATLRDQISSQKKSAR